MNEKRVLATLMTKQLQLTPTKKHQRNSN